MYSSKIMTETFTYFIQWANTFLFSKDWWIFICMIFLGAYFLRDCPVQPYIPVYLIVFGVFVLLVLIVSLGLLFGTLAKDVFELLLVSMLIISISVILYLFVVCWFITGEYICQIGVTEGGVMIFFEKNNGDIYVKEG